MLTLTVNPGVTRGRQASIWRQAMLSTQRPISRIESDSSATRMKSSGPIRPRSGCSQRTRASTPTIRPVAISTMGWYCRMNSRAEIACSRSADSWARAITASCMEGSKTTTLPLPRAFAEYIATSALRSRSPALSMPGRPAATPTLARTFTSRPSISKNEPIAAVNRLATRIDAFMSGVSRRSTANSSPPSRAAMSLERSTDPRRSPTATSSASPAA